MIPAGTLSRQVEAAAVLRGAKHEQLAREFIDFMLSAEFHEQIAETMFVYPVVAGLRPVWWKWATVSVTPAVLDPSPGEIERWIREWTAIVRR